MESPNSPSTTLFVADIPSNIQETDFVAVFKAQEGFKTARLRRDRNNHTVGFADFDDPESAALALETLQGYKWSIQDRGLTIHFSHNVTNSHSRRMESEKMGVSNSRNHHNQENGNMRAVQPSVSFMPDLTSSTPNLPIAPQQHHSQPLQSPPIPNYTARPELATMGSTPGLVNSYPNMFPTLPADASSTLYVEALPSDATEREVAHIFRPFPGFQSLRILTKESKLHPSRVYNLCFVEFDNKYQATFALNHLQGYRMDKDDTKGLVMSYAKTERKTKPHLPRNGDSRIKDSID